MLTVVTTKLIVGGLQVFRTRVFAFTTPEGQEERGDVGRLAEENDPSDLS